MTTFRSKDIYLVLYGLENIILGQHLQLMDKVSSCKNMQSCKFQRYIVFWHFRSFFKNWMQRYKKYMKNQTYLYFFCIFVGQSIGLVGQKYANQLDSLDKRGYSLSKTLFLITDVLNLHRQTFEQASNNNLKERKTKWQRIFI